MRPTGHSEALLQHVAGSGRSRTKASGNARVGARLHLLESHGVGGLRSRREEREASTSTVWSIAGGRSDSRFTTTSAPRFDRERGALCRHTARKSTRACPGADDRLLPARIRAKRIWVGRSSAICARRICTMPLATATTDCRQAKASSSRAAWLAGLCARTRRRGARSSSSGCSPFATTSVYFRKHDTRDGRQVGNFPQRSMSPDQHGA